MIRHLTENDWKVFRQIRLESLREEPAAFAVSAEEFEALPEQAVRGVVSSRPTFVAFEGDEPVGIMSLVRQNLSKKLHRANLIFVYLRATSRGKGISKALHAAVMDHARSIGVRQLELQVTAENLSAIEFYNRLGYSQVGRIPGGFMHDGREIDELVMAIRT